ncbi:MAG: hypothetical protein RBG13Loki_1788 [Promethearchaeota archaeon CR_4]|nr:MAG: hypothetical protein RBG13Loki_1788 [Candidatus Lokiarchaeota archaeon CR_4]
MILFQAGKPVFLDEFSDLFSFLSLKSKPELVVGGVILRSSLFASGSSGYLELLEIFLLNFDSSIAIHPLDN